MQDQNQTFSDFKRRTDDLAVRLGGIPIKKLAKQMDISPAMMSPYRTGAQPISDKAWAKLRALEAKAGIRIHSESDPEKSDASELHEDSSRYGLSRRVVAPLNPPRSESETTWEEVVGYIYTLKRKGFSPDQLIAVLEDSFPLAPLEKKPTDS